MMASAQRVVSLSGLLRFFKEDSNAVNKGEVTFNSGFVLKVVLNEMEISASVRASMKDRSYKGCLIVDGNGNIDSASCECPRGNWLCSHMAATAIYVNNKGFSKTNLPNSWIARPKQASKMQESEPQMMGDFFQSPKPNYCATSRAPNSEYAGFLLAELAQRNVDCPFRWLYCQKKVLKRNQWHLLS